MSRSDLAGWVRNSRLPPDAVCLLSKPVDIPAPVEVIGKVLHPESEASA